MAYPFAIPDFDFLYVNGAALPMRIGDGEPMHDGRVEVDGAWQSVADLMDRLGATVKPRLPVIGYGSNRSPDRLKEKYGGAPAPVVIPVARAWLEDFDVAYVAHFAHYGSVPAGLQYCPGTRVQVSVLWLDPAQLSLMHQSEAVGHHYGFGRLSPLRLGFVGGGDRSDAWTYVPLHGLARAPLDHSAGRRMADCAAALHAVVAERRVLPAMSQGALLDAVAARLQPGSDADRFVLRLLTDAAWRQIMTERLRQDAVAFAGGNLFERHKVAGEP